MVNFMLDIFRVNLCVFMGEVDHSAWGQCGDQCGGGDDGIF